MSPVLYGQLSEIHKRAMIIQVDVPDKKGPR